MNSSYKVHKYYKIYKFSSKFNFKLYSNSVYKQVCICLSETLIISAIVKRIEMLIDKMHYINVNQYYYWSTHNQTANRYFEWQNVWTLCPKTHYFFNNNVIHVFFLDKDIDECFNKTDLCDHNCTNTEGGYNCSCLNGFLLLEDERTCLFQGNLLHFLDLNLGFKGFW